MVYGTVVTIGGVDITSNVVGYKIIDSIDETTSATIELSNNGRDDLDYDTQQEVVITRGLTTSSDYTIFRGNIAKIENSTGERTRVTAYDKLWLLDRKSLTKTYDINIDPEAGVISAIAEDLIQTYGGLTADVEASGSINVLDKFYALNKSLLELLRELADLLDYTVYYDPNADTVNFKSRGFTSFGTILSVGDNIVEIPVWDYDYTKIANVVTVTGDFQELETTKSFVATALQTNFVLDFVPESVKVYEDAASPPTTLKVGGVVGQSTSFDYSVDKENKTIIFQTGVTGANNVEVRYSYLEPIVVSQKNPVSRAAFGDYTYDKYMDTIKTTSDGEKKINEIITKFGGPTINTKIRTKNVFGIFAGYSVTVVDPYNNENREVMVRRIIKEYPIVIDTLHIDNEPLFEEYILQNKTLERIDRLERKNQSRGTLINELFTLDRTYKPRRRYLKLQKETITDTDSLIWDHPTQGQWNDGGSNTEQWGGTAFGSTTVQKLVQGRMIYEEYCYDTDFHDAINSTATFSTVTNDISFTAGQIWYSSVIDLGTTLSQIKVDLGTVVGTVLIEISSDNKATWQTVTEGTLTTVTTSDGTGTFVRITENAVAVATIDLTQDSFGQNTEPVVKVTMIE